MRRCFTSVLSCLTLLFIGSTAFAQSYPIEPGNLDKAKFQKVISEFLKQSKGNNGEENFTTDELLDAAANTTIQFSEKEGKASTKHSKYPKAHDRLASVGGNKNALVAEFAFDVKVFKKGKFYTYDKAMIDFKKKLSKSKHLKIVKDPRFFFAGADLMVDSLTGKMYASVVLADIEALNNGTAHLEELTIPFTDKHKFGIDKGKNFKMSLVGLFGAGDSCAELDKAVMNELTFNAFYVDGNKVYLKADYLETVKSILPRKNNALAIDVVAQEQYPTDKYYNITDESLMTAGYLLKPIFGKDLNKAVEGSDYIVGELPADLTGKVNFNLFAYQSKNCHSGYVNKEVVNEATYYANFEAFRPVSLPLTYDTAGTKLPSFKAKENKIAFVFPFEQGKFHFKQGDIQPLIDSLGEPSFIINKVNLEAYSSIEGDSAINARLQIKRSGSIVGVLEKMNENNKIPYTVNTNTGWDMFKKQVKGTDYAYLADSSLAFVNDTLAQDRKLQDSLEHFLSAQRYAKVELYVTYKEPDLDENEYFLFKYKKALKQGRAKDALALMNELIKNGKKKELLAINIPGEPKFASLLNNILCIRGEKLNAISNFDEVYAFSKSLYENNPNHILLRYNYASLTLHALNQSKDMEFVKEKVAELKKMGKAIQVTPLLDYDEVNKLKMKSLYYYTMIGKELLDDKKENKKLLESVKMLTEVEDVIAFSDLFEKKGNKTASFELLSLNMNKFKKQMLDSKNEKEKLLAAQYALRMIPQLEKIEEENRYAMSGDVFHVLFKNDKELLVRLFDENHLSFQLYRNLWVKHYYSKATAVSEQGLDM